MDIDAKLLQHHNITSHNVEYPLMNFELFMG